VKTIVISIQVPDGVDVRVNGARQVGSSTGSSSGGGTFTQKPDPTYPPAPCEACGGDWRLIKAGVSKTKVDENGNPKRFNAFYVCNTPQCDGKPNYDISDPILDELGF